MLIQHADGVLAAARNVFSGLPIQLSVNIPGHHWWYNTASHAPEMTAGWVEGDGWSPGIIGGTTPHHMRLNDIRVGGG